MEIQVGQTVRRRINNAEGTVLSIDTDDDDGPLLYVRWENTPDDDETSTPRWIPDIFVEVVK